MYFVINIASLCLRKKFNFNYHASIATRSLLAIDTHKIMLFSCTKWRNVLQTVSAIFSSARAAVEIILEHNLTVSHIHVERFGTLHVRPLLVVTCFWSHQSSCGRPAVIIIYLPQHNILYNLNISQTNHRQDVDTNLGN